MQRIEADHTVIYNGVEMKVLKSGDYEDSDLVEIYNSNDPNKTPIYAFQANWIITGKNIGE